MSEDFNPLDLSAPKKSDDLVQVYDTMKPKVTVHKVGMGPLLHSRSMKITVVFLLIILAGLGSYIGTAAYLDGKINAAKLASQTEATSADTNMPILDTPAEAPTNTETPTQDPDTATSSPTSPSTAGNAASPVFCGVNGMPEGACTAITSIEKDGLKNNKYVSADTSNIPAGTTVQIDEKSWNQGGPEIGSVNFTGKSGSQSFSGQAFFQVTGGTWKVISYTLN